MSSSHFSFLTPAFIILAWADALTQDRSTKASTQLESYLLSVGFSVLLLTIILLSYSRFLAKKKYIILLDQSRREIDGLNKTTQLIADEREWLLKEIHHRVKNNLQLVISLLNTQSAYLNNEEALLAVKDSEHRMHAMSLIHQKLYQSDRLSCINMKQYINELVSYLRENIEQGNRLCYHLQVEDISFDVSQALPLGLILNEAITNVIKYAFEPEQPNKEVVISLVGRERQYYTLKVADNGKGLPKSINLKKPNSLGINLMKGLTRQLGGNFYVLNKLGCQLTIKFERIKILQQGAPFTENC